MTFEQELADLIAAAGFDAPSVGERREEAWPKIIAAFKALREKLAAAEKKLASPIFKDDVNGEIEVQCLRARAEAAEARLKEVEKELHHEKVDNGRYMDRAWREKAEAEARAERLREALAEISSMQEKSHAAAYFGNCIAIAEEAIAADSANPSDDHDIPKAQANCEHKWEPAQKHMEVRGGQFCVRCQAIRGV